jgi:transcriptional repressor NrdR
MRCPFCGVHDTKVIDSRLASEGDQIRRRRECLACEVRFTTYEVAELSLPRVVKRDGSRELFVVDKVRAGFLRALQKRQVSTEAVEAALGQMIHRLQTRGEREVSSQQIGEWVMDALKRLDAVAYIRFASVYRGFQNLEAFEKEIEQLK